MADTKVCRTCGKEKAVGEFYRKRVLKSGAIRYRLDCTECMIAATAADPLEKERIRRKTADWRAADPDRGRKSCRDSHGRHRADRIAKQSADRIDPEKRPKLLAQGRKSYQTHRLRRIADSKAWVEANPDYRPAYAKEYWRANPEMASKCHATRRARKAAAEGHHTAADIKAIRVRQDDFCANPSCAVPLHGRGSLDHVVALANGGSNWPFNLQLLCKPCNSMKRSRDNETFLRCYAEDKKRLT